MDLIFYFWESFSTSKNKQTEGEKNHRMYTQPLSSSWDEWRGYMSQELIRTQQTEQSVSLRSPDRNWIPLQITDMRYGNETMGGQSFALSAETVLRSWRATVYCVAKFVRPAMGGGGLVLRRYVPLGQQSTIEWLQMRSSCTTDDMQCKQRLHTWQSSPCSGVATYGN